MHFYLLSLLGYCVASVAGVSSTFYDHLPTVKKTGVLVDTLSKNISTLNPLLANTLEDSRALGSLFMSLYDIDLETYEYFPSLAEKVEVSKDKKTYTYTLNALAKWEDGTPVTSADVEFSFQKLMDPKVEAAPKRSFFDGVTFKVLDTRRFQFQVPHPRFNTISSLHFFDVIQKKQFEKESDFNHSKENLKIIGNGPYRFKNFSRDQRVELELNDQWWAKNLPAYKNRFNTKQIIYQIISDPILKYERFLRGDIDQIEFSSEQYAEQVLKTDRNKIGESPQSGKKVWARALKTDAPKQWYGLAYQLKNPLFERVQVRQALAHLVDYDWIIQKIFYGWVDRCTSPFGSFSMNSDPELQTKKNLFPYDIKKGVELLKMEGWTDSDRDGILDKVINGKKTPFRFELKVAASNPAGLKIAQSMQQSFRKAGVVLTIRPLESNVLFDDFHQSRFEALFIGWGGGMVHPDAKQLWHSDSIREGGSNRVGYSNARVDALIQTSNEEFQLKKRAKTLQAINRILYQEQPYLFLVERRQLLLGFHSRLVSPHWVLKYSSGHATDLYSVSE